MTGEELLASFREMGAPRAALDEDELEVLSAVGKAVKTLGMTHQIVVQAIQILTVEIETLKTEVASLKKEKAGDE